MLSADKDKSLQGYPDPSCQKNHRQLEVRLLSEVGDPAVYSCCHWYK